MMTGSSPSTGSKMSTVSSVNFLSKETAKFFSALPATTIGRSLNVSLITWLAPRKVNIG
jgi:hypothetical protein